MRMLSVAPLTEGVPCHCATDGILSSPDSSLVLAPFDNNVDAVACASLKVVSRSLGKRGRAHWGKPYSVVRVSYYVRNMQGRAK
jgi:hypothetical protein